jgi:hypothetical protein
LIGDFKPRKARSWVLMRSGRFRHLESAASGVVAGAAAGDAIAWADRQTTTRTSVFEGAGLGAGQAHGVGLMGVSAASGITAANGGIHIARTLSL